MTPILTINEYTAHDRTVEGIFCHDIYGDTLIPIVDILHCRYHHHTYGILFRTKLFIACPLLKIFVPPLKTFTITICLHYKNKI